MPTDPKTWEPAAIVGHIENLKAYLDELVNCVIMNDSDDSETFALLAQAKLEMIVESVSK